MVGKSHRRMKSTEVASVNSDRRFDRSYGLYGVFLCGE
jgi:hypothetical protein